jgi:hypothetical protein
MNFVELLPFFTYICVVIVMYYQYVIHISVTSYYLVLLKKKNFLFYCVLFIGYFQEKG